MSFKINHYIKNTNLCEEKMGNQHSEGLSLNMGSP